MRLFADTLSHDCTCQGRLTTSVGIEPHGYILTSFLGCRPARQAAWAGPLTAGVSEPGAVGRRARPKSQPQRTACSSPQGSGRRFCPRGLNSQGAQWGCTGITPSQQEGAARGGPGSGHMALTGSSEGTLCSLGISLCLKTARPACFCLTREGKMDTCEVH